MTALGNRYYLVRNGALNGFGFMKITPPYEAFTQIESWLNNQARPQKPIPHVPDEVMAEIKGFDKFSFRKPKERK